ncbi:hypothetical protein Adt_20479 [Abeliophyllum distichum]|uniref:Uncharacterized protein n=1 Tax=Abeliophyllum distichum TaxID=126358 RepID=A0ABD1SWV8_9LAMI
MGSKINVIFQQNRSTMVRKINVIFQQNRSSSPATEQMGVFSNKWTEKPCCEPQYAHRSERDWGRRRQRATGCGEDSERPGSYAPTTTATGLGEDVGAEENVRAERVSLSDTKRRANEMGERKHAAGG